jgi:hypothetical protein
MRFPVIRRFLLLLPAVIAAIALSATPALAGEDDGGGGGDDGSATLHASQGCVSGPRAKAAVTGDNIDRVAFYVDGNLVKTVTRPNAQGRFSMSMKCSRLSVGAHGASAVVTFEQGTTPARQTLRFQITRAQQVSPRYTG